MDINVSINNGQQPNLEELTQVDTGGRGNIDLSQQVQNAITLDPTKTDSVTAFEVISDQNIRISGKIEIHRTPDGYKVIISLNPEDPDIANTNSNGQVNTGGGWFATSFIAAFTSVMSEVLSTLRKIGWMEAQTEMQTRTQIYDMALNQAELIKSDYALQSREAQLQAIQSFVSGAISTVQFASTISNSKRATNEANDATAADMTKAKADVDKYYDKDGNLKPGPKVALAEPADLVALKADRAAAQAKVDASSPPSAADQKALHDANVKVAERQAAFNKEVDTAQKTSDEKWATDAAVAKEKLQEVNNKRDDIYFRRLQHYDQSTNTIAQILNSAVAGATKTAESAIKTQQGEINAEKTIMQSLMEMLNKYGDNSAKHRDEAKRSFSEYVNSLQQTVHSNIQAHMSR